MKTEIKPSIDLEARIIKLREHLSTLPTYSHAYHEAKRELKGIRQTLTYINLHDGLKREYAIAHASNLVEE